MMDGESQEKLNAITSKSLASLTKADLIFLKARRSYLNPSQRLAYEGLNLFAADKKAEEATTAKK